MRRLSRFFAFLSLAALALAIVVPMALASAARIATLKPVLRGYPGARGAAQYQSQPGQRELDVEVNHLSALAGKRVVVYVGGSKLGASRVSSRGVVEFSRNTETGQSVPQVRAGTPIALATDKAVILVGSF
jgi:hypothetical protein